ncbi:MAG: zinc ribbon domain-containing protein [Prevotellaceae bacterium]|nr:zinc ribbon domain-containing protein [Candidatus Minthosoma caballi]
MAIIKCPECNREVSDMANACPHCGFPIQQYLKSGRANKPIPNSATQATSPKPQNAETTASSGSTASSSANASSSATASSSASNATSSETTAQAAPAVAPTAKKSAGGTIAIITIVILALAGGAVWYLFFRGGNDNDENSVYEKIMRYENEKNYDSLSIALEEYLDTYIDGAAHYQLVKNLNDRFTTERADWNAAEKLESVEAIHRFLDSHPDGFYRERANMAIDSLSYAEALKADTKEAYERYLDQFVDGKFVAAVQKKISDLDKKELSAEESSNVKRTLSNHFEALANNDKTAIQMTLASTVNSYIGKNDPTEEDIFAYMAKVHQNGRTIIFNVNNARVSKVDAGGRSVYNVQFALDEETYSTSVSSLESIELESESTPTPDNVKHFTGTAVLNEAMRITSLVLKAAAPKAE